MGEKINVDPWGLAYKVVTHNLGVLRLPCIMDTVIMGHIMEGLIPTRLIRREAGFDEVGDIPLFNEEELCQAVKFLHNKKVLGPDDILGDVLKQ